jgi:hypothetical protein
MFFRKEEAAKCQKIKKAQRVRGLLPLLGFPISLRYIGINFSPNKVHKKTRFAPQNCGANRVLFCSPS